MRYMAIIKATPESEAGLPPDPRLLAAMGELVEKSMKEGILVDTGGLAPSSHGARVTAANGALSITDGPFSETKELIGGYAILEVPSKEDALQAACQFMQVHLDVLGPGYEGVCEVRPMGCSGDREG